MKAAIVLEFNRKKVVVIGAGDVGVRRAIKYQSYGAEVLVISRSFSLQARKKLEENGISWLVSDYCPGVLNGMQIVTAATGDSLTNQKIIKDARKFGILSNSAESGEGDFQFPGESREGSVLISVTTGVPALTKKIRKFIDLNIGELSVQANSLHIIRDAMKERGVSTRKIEALTELSTSELSELQGKAEDFMSGKTIRIGTRGSKLALAQTEEYKTRLEKANPEVAFETVVIRTSGDENQTDEVKMIGQSVFTREIEKALLDGEIDLAVHSLKDLPSELPEGLELAPPPKREDARDVMIVKKEVKDKNPYAFLSEERVVGTGSPRRAAQLREIGEKTVIKPIRGNVDTRIEKLLQGDYDAIVLAKAGLNRLGIDLESKGLKEIELPKDFVPAAGQGILGVEIREGDQAVRSLVGPLADLEATKAMHAEREVLRLLGGDCTIPAGAYLRMEDEVIAVMSGLYGDQDGVTVTGEFAGPPDRTTMIARTLADALKERLKEKKSE